MAAKGKTKPKARTGAHGNVKASLNNGMAIPAEVKKLRGTYHPHNEDKKKSAKAKLAVEASGGVVVVGVECTDGDLVAPDTLLDDMAVREWNSFIIPMAKAGIIKLSDLRYAELYCNAWSIYQDYMQSVKQARQNGENHRALFYPRNLVADIAGFLRNMGMTPVARSKIIAYIGAGLGKTDIPDKTWGEILSDDD